MRVTDFHFDLPPKLIAKHPPVQRDAARMLTLDRATGAIADRTFRDFPARLRPGDLVVLNNSRVIPARLFGRRAGLHTQSNSPAPTGLIEVLLTRQESPTDWHTLVKPARKVQPGETLLFGDGDTSLTATVLHAGERGERTLRFDATPDFFARLDRLGHIPLPPYLHRADTPEDRARYQTVYAAADTHGSAAAPTAGLHFTPDILESVHARGAETAYLTLHVGLGTFQPVQVEDLADIRLHAESYTLPPATATAINAARAQGRRIVAVGTTTVRTLEHCARAANGRPLQPHSGQTSIFLKPGDPFYLVDALLTNFHLPQSTLLMLVSAFAGAKSGVPGAGIEQVLHAYRHAVAHAYRFFSYGDCMLVD